MLSFVSRAVYLSFKVSTTVIHAKAVSGDKLTCLFALAASLILLGPPRLMVKLNKEKMSLLVKMIAFNTVHCTISFYN